MTQARALAAHLDRRDAAGIDRQRPAAHRVLEHDVVEIDLFVGRRRALVEPRQREQIGDQGLEPGGLGEHAVQHGGRRRAIGVRQRDLDLHAGGGDRAAQLVRRIGHELALAPGGLGEPIEHGVQRVGELAELVADRRRAAAVRRSGPPQGRPRVDRLPGGAASRDLAQGIRRVH